MRDTPVRSRWFANAAWLAAGAVLLSLPASAQEKKKDDWFRGWRYELALGSFYANVDTRVRLDATDLPGTEFSFENDLGLDENDSSFIGSFSTRFGRRSSLHLTGFSLNRGGTSESRISITLPDPDDPDDTIVIDEDLVVTSFFNVDTLRLSYRYSFINNPKAEFGIEVGLHVTAIELGLSTPNQPQIPTTAEDVTAPLPTLGVQGGYRFAENWYAMGNLGYFALEIDDIDGSITAMTAGVVWQPFKNVGFGLSYQYFDVEVKATTDSFGGVGGEFRWRYAGPAAYLAVRF